MKFNDDFLFNISVFSLINYNMSKSQCDASAKFCTSLLATLYAAWEIHLPFKKCLYRPVDEEVFE
jgi:hypothetical protein